MKRFKKIMAAFSIAVLMTVTACSSLEEEFVDNTSQVEEEIVIPKGNDGGELMPEITGEDEVVQEDTVEKETAETSPVYEGNTPLEIHGKLSVKDTYIVDKNGEVVQLCGVSTHGLGWFPEYVNKDSFKSLRDDFGANVVRLAMYTAEGAGYCTGGNRDNLKKTVTDGVEYATELGMYVIIDWHILHDLDPNVYKDDAKAFFAEMSLKYADYDNVIYEICNEPNGGTSWSSVKSYAEEVIPVIRANDPDAIIIVGTPNWSQDVDEAAKDPITGYDNIMYAVHFYADTHKEWLRDKIDKALKKGLPVFISEFSICDASGNGNNNIKEADKWIKYLDKNNISFVAWNLSNKNESSSLIAAGCQKKSGWTYNDLSESGKWLINVLNTHSDQGSNIANGTVSEAVTENETSVNIPSVDTSKSESVASDKKGELEASVSESNSWESGDYTCVQYTLTLNNKGNTDVSGWSIDIEFDKDISIDQIWCSKGSVNGKTLHLEPEDYNSTISGNKSTSDIGFIVKAKGKAEANKIKVK